jgi:hypothetical protein
VKRHSVRPADALDESLAAAPSPRAFDRRAALDVSAGAEARLTRARDSLKDHRAIVTM